MFNSTNFNTTFYEDNNSNNNIPLLFNQPIEEITPFYYYDHIQSPLFYYDVENFVESLNNNDDDHLTMIQEPLQTTNSSVVTDDSSILEVTTTNNNKMDSSSNKGSDEVSGKMVNNNNKPKRRRTSTKDRHSKIRTAQGLRDRRMRLSLEVAKPFFRLQDMLGFDKASKTVEWLLNQSKIVIDEVKVSKIGSSSGVTISSNSDCEVESIVVDQKNDNNNIININKGKKCIVNVGKEGKKNNNKEKRMRTTKEAMKKARDKARKRTLEKMMQSRGGGIIIINKENNNNNNNNNDDANSMNHISGGGDFVDVSLLQNWNSSSTNFNY